MEQQKEIARLAREQEERNRRLDELERQQREEAAREGKTEKTPTSDEEVVPTFKNLESPFGKDEGLELFSPENTQNEDHLGDVR